MTITVNEAAPTQAQTQDFRKAFDLAPGPLGFDRPVRFAFAGDSIAGQWSSRDGLSPLWWAATELYPCEYETLLSSAAGGTPASHLITNQIAQLEALSIKPDVVIVQTLQNNFIGSVADADTNFAFVQQYSERALAAGVKLVVICSHPPKSSSPDVASAVYYLNRKLEQYCRATPGNFYCDVFSAWRKTDTQDTSGVAWRGTANGVDAFSDDGTHPTSLAANAAAPLIVPVLARFARSTTPMANAAVAYDNSAWPFNNVLGVDGLMIGTGGTYNGANNAGVAGRTQAARERWELVDGNGIVATPSLVTGPDGYRYQRLDFSGTASAAATVTLTRNFVHDVAVGNFVSEAVVHTYGLTGVRGMDWNVQGFAPSHMQATANMQLPIANSRFHFRTAITSYSNGGSANKSNTLTIRIANGATVSGYLLFGRAGIFRLS